MKVDKAALGMARARRFVLVIEVKGRRTFYKHPFFSRAP